MIFIYITVVNSFCKFLLIQYIFVKVNVYYAIMREVNMNLIQAQMGTSTSTAMSTSSGGSNAVAYGPGLSPQPGFSYRNVWKPLTISFIGK